jgi:hypothetical protein
MNLLWSRVWNVDLFLVLKAPTLDGFPCAKRPFDV